MEELVAQTAEPQRRLKGTEIGKYWPQAENDQGLQEFCDFLSTRFGYDTLFPIGFIQLVVTALDDLARGKDGRNNDAPIGHPAAGYEPMFYSLFSGFIPSIAEAIFDPEFAAGVRKDYDRVLGKDRKKAKQGLVTVRKGGEVVMKIAVGIDGDKASVVAAAIRKLGRVPPIWNAVEIVADAGFGVKEDRIVMTATDFQSGDGKLPEIYRSTFSNPNFNPRSDHGTADYIEIVDV